MTWIPEVLVKTEAEKALSILSFAMFFVTGSPSSLNRRPTFSLIFFCCPFFLPFTSLHDWTAALYSRVTYPLFCLLYPSFYSLSSVRNFLLIHISLLLLLLFPTCWGWAFPELGEAGTWISASCSGLVFSAGLYGINLASSNFFNVKKLKSDLLQCRSVVPSS